MYATLTDMQQRFGAAELIQQTDLVGDGHANADTVARALGDASALMDGYLATRCPLPIVEPPPVLVGICCDLARYALYVDAAPELVERRRDQAVATLRDIAAGRVQLGMSTATPSVPAPSGLAEVVQPGRRIFGGGLR